MHNIIAGNLPENIFVILFRISRAFQVHENIPPSVKILFELWCPVLENLINNKALVKKKEMDKASAQCDFQNFISILNIFSNIECRCSENKFPLDVNTK